MIFIGILIGFYGYLLPSNINLMLVELYGNRKISLLIAVLVLVVFFEGFYSYFTLKFLSDAGLSKQTLYYLKLLAEILMVGMGFLMFFEKKDIQKTANNILSRGLFSTIVHPQQIPYWLFVGIILEDNFDLKFTSNSLIIFVLANAIGTALILSLYAFFGNKLLTLLNVNIGQINKLIGIIYIVLGLISLFRLS